MYDIRRRIYDPTNEAACVHIAMYMLFSGRLLNIREVKMEIPCLTSRFCGDPQDIPLMACE
jgi:hypothetical protein